MTRYLQDGRGGSSSWNVSRFTVLCMDLATGRRRVEDAAPGKLVDMSVAVSYFNMGPVYRSLGKAEEAREMFTKAYSIFLKVLGPDHPHTQKAKSEVD